MDSNMREDVTMSCVVFQRSGSVYAKLAMTDANVPNPVLWRVRSYQADAAEMYLQARIRLWRLCGFNEGELP